MENQSFPIIIKDGRSVITFTDAENGTYASGEKCVSSLADYMVCVLAGNVTIVRDITVAFFADRREVEQVITVQIPAIVPVDKRVWAASHTIRKIFPDAYSFTEVKTAPKMIGVECGGLPDGYETAAAGH